LGLGVLFQQVVQRLQVLERIFVCQVARLQAVE
jgi:hypothetical protein